MAAPSTADSKVRSGHMQIRFTRLGLHFLFVAVFAMAGGAIRGFNLLLVLAGALIAILIVQWRCSRRAMESLQVERSLPQEAFCDKTFRVRYQVRNRSGWLSVWMIRVDDELKRIHSDQRSGVRKFLGSSLSPIACGVGHVASKATAATYSDCVIHRRGRYQFGELRLSTSFPFSLLCATSRQVSSCSIDVYPKLLTLHRGWQRQLLTQTGDGLATARRSGVGEGEFYGLRQWHRGDSPRQIHWRTTARIGDLAVRQNEESRRIEACFLIDGWMPSAKKAHTETVETVFSLAATLAVHLDENPDNAVSIVTVGNDVSAAGRVIHGRGANEMLQILARFEGKERSDLLASLQAAWEINGARKNLIVLSSRSCVSALQAIPGLDASLTAWRRKTAVKWIDVSDVATNAWFSCESKLSVDSLGGVL
ncbi:MAG: DUF58 domain-containing protein [Pirellulaceae bacterium]